MIYPLLVKVVEQMGTNKWRFVIEVTLYLIILNFELTCPRGTVLRYDEYKVELVCSKCVQKGLKTSLTAKPVPLYPDIRLSTSAHH